MRVLAAMSGGVDSAVAAARAVDAGHDVVGVHLALSRMPGTLRTGSRGCCTIEDAQDARRAANMMGMPFYVWDFSARFKEDVVDDFIAEYTAGRTPNPCLRCNEKIKFAALLEKALALGFDAVCTGHYADIRFDDQGNRQLHRASAWAKDQSYVLGVLTAEQLDHCMFPLGATPSKDEVRAEAEQRGFSVANKPDSYDICFIPDGDTKGWLEDKIGKDPGQIVDESGTVLGEHDGAHSYTVGQRRGLALGHPAPDGKPRYVLNVSPKTKTVVVGPKEHLEVGAIRGIRLSWCGQPLEAQRFECFAQVRAHGEPVPAVATVLGDLSADLATVKTADTLQQTIEASPATAQAAGQHAETSPTPRARGVEIEVVLDTPIKGVAPGQTVVLYQDTRVLGQATIDTTETSAPAGVADYDRPQPAHAYS